MMFTRDLYKKGRRNHINITMLIVIFVTTIVSVVFGSNKFTLLQIETNLSRFRNRTIAMKVTIELDDYYNFSFSNSKSTHYCFKISDGSNTISGTYVYGKKRNSSVRKLRYKLLKNNNNPIKSYIKFRIREQNQLLGELLSTKR